LAVSSKRVVEGALREWPDGKASRVADHQARTMNGGSEHLNGCSQWGRVGLQIMITNMQCGNRIVTLPSKRVFDSFWLVKQQAMADARLL